MKHLLKFKLFEGKTAKATKKPYEKESFDADKKETFRTTIKDFITSKDCKVKKVGDDFEIHCDKNHIAQIMFRNDKITLKEGDSKFGKDFKYTELGKLKATISKCIKGCKK